MQESLYWHDYETSGVDYIYDRPMQFAGIRTDNALNEIGEPLVEYCKPSKDFLPNPEAILITGITPQHALEHGLPEYQFAARIHAVFAEPNTCRVGYNNVGFDDHVTRYLLHRNLYKPYDCESQNNNSRWDILNMVRACGAFRPEGLEWSFNKAGEPGYSLARLAAVNNIEHAQAHDALSDVRATIGLARLIKEHQPKLFDYSFKIRKPQSLRDILPQDGKTPVLHVSFHYGNAQYCVGMLLPLMDVPKENKRLIFYNLSIPPSHLLDCDEDTLSNLAHDHATRQKLGVQIIAINQCPFLVSMNILNNQVIDRIGLPLEEYQKHAQQVIANIETLRDRITRSYERAGQISDKYSAEPQDADHCYANGFLRNEDAQLLTTLRNSDPENLNEDNFNFKTPWLPELLFRYKARNFTEALNAQEKQRWNDFCKKRLNESGKRGLTVDGYLACINNLRLKPDIRDRDSVLLNSMEDWLDVVQS